jgi:hypothetical protein
MMAFQQKPDATCFPASGFYRFGCVHFRLSLLACNQVDDGRSDNVQRCERFVLFLVVPGITSQFVTLCFSDQILLVLTAAFRAKQEV